MISLLFSSPLVFFIVFPGLLLSIAIHEFAHCYITDKLGDPTPRAKGRVTLDPRVHLDMLGTLAILFTGFGWGKPAPFDPYNLKEPVRDTALIAVAGPITNIIIATVLAFIIRMGVTDIPLITFALFQILTINIMLAVFNLVPIYPLDGSRILMALLPAESAMEYERFMERYGIYLLMLLIFPWAGGNSPVSYLINPIVQFIVQFMAGLG